MSCTPEQKARYLQGRPYVPNMVVRGGAVIERCCWEGERVSDEWRDVFTSGKAVSTAFDFQLGDVFVVGEDLAVVVIEVVRPHLVRFNTAI